MWGKDSMKGQSTKWRRSSIAGLAVMLWLLAVPIASAQTVKYIHTDSLGSVAVVTDQNRNIVERREYEPYGAVLTGLKDGPGYAGHVTDAQTGLTYMQQRYYDPGIGTFLSVDPVTAYEKGDMRYFNRYAYVFNNPYKFTDRDGREVAFDKAAPADFLMNVARAIRYLNAAGVARPVGEVKLSDKVVTIRPAQDRTDAAQSKFDPATNTITWADKGAIKVIDSRTGEKASISPALALGHEFDHAANALYDLASESRDANTFDKTYGNQEERNVIEEYERPAAEKLGEGVRADHGGRPVPVPCPTPECK